MRIDTHQHFWKLARGDYSWLSPDLEPLYRDFLPSDLKPLLEAAGLDGTIAVQAADREAETDYLLSLAARHDWIKGVVGLVDLEAGTAVASIQRLAQDPKFLGLRPMLQDIADDAWMLRPALGPALATMARLKLTFDALVLPRHLPHLQTFVTRYSDLNVVIDHGAKPEIHCGKFQPWADYMQAFADHPQVFCKISGLVTEAGADWTPADLALYLQHLLQVFGPDRLLFGSDWPVLNLAGQYSGWADLVRHALGTDAETVLARNPFHAYPRLSASGQDLTGHRGAVRSAGAKV